MDDHDMDIFETLLLEEAERQAKPCCANCRWFYTEYGYDCCKVWEYPKEDVNHEKCTEWR